MTNKEKKLFEDAFYLGFMTTFDGWNGESFSLFQRKPSDSIILIENMKKRRKEYEFEQNEKSNLFTTPHIPKLDC